MVVLLAIALASLLLALNVPLRALLEAVEWMKEEEKKMSEEKTRRR